VENSATTEINPNPKTTSTMNKVFINPYTIRILLGFINSKGKKIRKFYLTRITPSRPIARISDAACSGF